MRGFVNTECGFIFIDKNTRCVYNVGIGNKEKRGEIMAEFKDRLKELRLNAHMTQKDLGQALGISSSTVGMYEQGARTPDMDTLENIADYFNVDIDFLLGRVKGSTYYLRPEVAKLAQEAYDDPDLKILLKAKQDLSEVDFNYVVALVKRLKGDSDD